MKPVIDINIVDHKKNYNKFNAFSKVTDRLKTKFKGESDIKDLGIKVYHVRIPNNRNRYAYIGNILKTRKLVKEPEAILSPKAIRIFDYSLFNDCQKKLFAYSVVKSTQLILRNSNSSIKDSCILIDDAAEEIVYEIIKEISKYSRHIILLSKRPKICYKIRDFVIANYGISPEVTFDEVYAINEADFIISTKSYSYEHKNTWYIDNLYRPEKSFDMAVNDVLFKVPWITQIPKMSPELLGGILGQMKEKDIGKVLKYYGIFIEEIRFNERVIEL